MNAGANDRPSNRVVVSRRYSLFSKEIDSVLGDGGIAASGTPTLGRLNRRRCSLFFDDQDSAAITDSVKICNTDPNVINDATADVNLDAYDDSLASIKDHWRVTDKQERNLSLAMNFDIKSLFSCDEETRRASMAFAKFVSEELDTANVTHPTTKHERTLSLAMNFDMKSLFSSDEESRRASIAFAKLITDELDSAKAAHNRQPYVDSQKEDPPLPISSDIDSPSFFQNNLANYYLMIRENLCNAMHRSEATRAAIGKMKTRAAIGNMNANILTQAPQLRDSPKKSVIKRSQPSKHLSGRKER